MKYEKTEAGQLAFKTRSAELSARQRSAFILFDGKKSVADVLKMTAGIGVSEGDVTHMLTSGFLRDVSERGPSDAQAVAAMAQDEGLGGSAGDQVKLSAQERFARAWPIATQLVAGLGLRGFRLNLAIEAAADYEGLRDLLPRIREAVGAEKVKALEQALRE